MNDKSILSFEILVLSLLYGFNKEQHSAYKKYRNGDNICIVGQGGSGKSYFANKINNGKVLYMAPTGMAALNLNEEAKTLHSCLKIGEKCLFAHNFEKVAKDLLKVRSSLIKLFDKYETLIFEEGSMILSGLFRTFVQIFHIIYETSSEKVFNGKQVIFLMDPQQLQPVPSQNNAQVDMEKQYNKKLLETDYIVNNSDFKLLFNKDNIIEFKHNHRSDDPVWRAALEAARLGFNGYSSEDISRHLGVLNRRVIDPMDLIDESNNTDIIEKYKNNTITTLKRDTVHKHNIKSFKELKDDKTNGPVYTVERKVLISEEDFIKKYRGQFKDPKKCYRTSLNFQDDLGGYYSYYNKDDKSFKTVFKVIKNMVVMLRTNKLHDNLKNGSIGTIRNFNLNSSNNIETIDVYFDSIDKVVEVNEILFKHPEFSDICVQAFPLIPASAITIHKLQGQTIERPLFINFDDIPFPEKKNHLLYTGISRPKKKEDLYIISSTPIEKKHFPVDETMYKWYHDNCLVI